MKFKMQSLENVRMRVEIACEKAGRPSHAVKILAVSKRHPANSVREACLNGQNQFGENQLQEALEKMGQLDDLPIEWHYIGTVQSNKTREIAQSFSWVQSVDRVKILQRLGRQRPRALGPLNICLQVNIDAEPQKSGVLPQELPELALSASQTEGIRLRGLMAIPQASADPAQQADSFRRVAAAYQELCGQGYTLDTLSMGMSADLEAAIAQGSTMVRIGTDIFGPRPVLL